MRASVLALVVSIAHSLVPSVRPHAPRRRNDHAMLRHPARLQRLVLEGAATLAPTRDVPDDVLDAIGKLAGITVAMLAGDEEAAVALAGGAETKQETIAKTLAAFDDCSSGTLSRDEAQALFTSLARSIVTELAEGANTRSGARAHARRVLADDERGTIDRVASKLLLLADADGDGKVSLTELAGLFDVVQRAPRTNVFPQPLRALAGSLQLLPPTEGTDVTSAPRGEAWHVGRPGDDHSLKTIEFDKGLSVVGLGRSADASAYFLPELGIVFDCGIHVKSINPLTVLLTHGHRDHTAALPTHARTARKIVVPKKLEGAVRKFLLAEAQLNYGFPQTDEETVDALGEFPLQPVEDGDKIVLDKDCYRSSPTPIGVEVFRAPHKGTIPAVSYGVYREKARLREEYASLPKSELGRLLRSGADVRETYEQGLIWFSGDTRIELLRERWREILPKYRTVIHEVTFLGAPSESLDESARRKGHTHYTQLHPWIAAFPKTTFVLVHWSLRYSRDDVLAFFDAEYGGVPKNVVLWI